METSIYLELTEALNRDRLRVTLSSGQAVVYYRIAMNSKDGDWIIREDQETVDFILEYLESWGAIYRIGAPLALPWLAGGWSSHFEFGYQDERIRADFVSRPPRMTALEVKELWQMSEQSDFPVIQLPYLAAIKQTRREKDYVVIGELARSMPIEDELRYSRSAQDIIRLMEEAPLEWRKIAIERPVLDVAKEGIEALEIALDAERRSAMRLDDHRIRAYAEAGEAWRKSWFELSKISDTLPLRSAHAFLLEAAERLLPANVLY